MAGAHVLACLALFTFLSRAFDFGDWVLLIHAPLVIALLCTSIAAGGVLLHLCGQRRGGCYAAAIPPAIVFTFLCLLYLGNFVSHRWLSISVTHDLALLWIQDWWRGRQLLSLSSDLLATAIAAIATLFVLDLLIWARTLRAFQPSWPRRSVAGIGLVLLITGYAVFFQQAASAAPRSELLDADPILAFVRTERPGVDARQMAIFERLRQEEPRHRTAYGRHTFDRKNVIVITVDSLRADHMQVYGYARPTTPFLSRLRAEGKLRRVEFATSTCAESNCGIVSTLFSKTLRHQVPEDFTLFALLTDQGYDTHFILSGNHNWQGLREMYGQELTSYFDGDMSARYGWSDDRVLFEGLDRIGTHARPSFFYFHLMSPHILGYKDQRFRAYQPAVVKLNMDALWRGDYDHTSVVNNYDNGVLQADATIRDLFAALDRKGYLRNSIVVILADHGEALGDRAARMYGHINWLYQETIRIPMLIYDESPTAYHGLAFGTQVDVAPTIVDRLGLPIPQQWEGVSLLDDAAPRQTMHQTRLTKPCFALIDYAPERMMKYMQCTSSASDELYDLTQDAAERHNLAENEPALVAGYRQMLDRWRNW